MKRNIRVSLTILVCCGGAWAQQAIEFGSVSGMIFDNYGDGLPDTTVVLSNPMLGVRRTMITTDDGLFNAAAVEPSRGYRLKVTRKGFADWESGDFQVALGQTLNLKINMRPAATSTHVEAVAVPQQMDQLKNGISFRIGSQQVEELPAPDLRLDPLVLLAPEANTEDASGQLAFHGVRSSNVFLTDGINTTDSFYPQKLGIASQLSQESVQEMQVLSSDFPAEFGRAMGGAVNAVSQSGSNNYHGAAYDYSRITGLAAHDRYAMGQVCCTGRIRQEPAWAARSCTTSYSSSRISNCSTAISMG